MSDELEATGVFLAIRRRLKTRTKQKLGAPLGIFFKINAVAYVELVSVTFYRQFSPVKPQEG